EHQERVRGAARVAGKRSEQRRQQGDHDDQRGQQAPGQQQRVVGQPAPQGLAARESRARGGQGAGRLDHLSRIRGSMAAWKMSTARLATTYTRAMNRVTPRMAGVSRLVIEAVV